MRAALNCFACFAASAIVLIGCSGGSLPPPDPFDDRAIGIGGNGTFLEESVRIETIRAARDAHSRGGATRAAQDAAMVAFFLAHKNIEAAGIGPQVGNVWARFIDGTLYVDFSAREQDLPVVRSPITPRLFELPGSLSAITANSLQIWWPDTSVSVANMLKKGSTYNVTGQKVEMTVAHLEAMRNVGVLYWQTHSAEGSLREKQRDPAGNVLKDPITQLDLHIPAFGYQTSDTAMVIPSAEIGEMRNKNMLMIGNAALIELAKDKQDFREVYGVTATFITAKMASAFAPDALVAIDSCTGASPEMISAWEKVGVSGFVSWDGLSGKLSGIAFERLFDRLLGANTINPISTPSERPFAFEPVRDWMKAKGYDLDPSPKTLPTDKAAALVFWNKPAFGILRPSITNMLFEASKPVEPFAKLLIQGTFGSDPGPRGAVEWGGQPLTVVRWTPTAVTVRLPPGPTYPTGAIVVSVDGRKSQSSHLTEWTLPLTFTKSDRGTLKAVVTVNCHLRADVRGFRLAPEEPPRFTLMNTNSLRDSTGSIAGSGSYVGPNNMPQITWGGSNLLEAITPLDGKNFPANNYFSCGGHFEASGEHTLKLILNASASYTVNKDGVQSQGIFGPGAHFFLGVPLPLDWATRTIAAGSATGMPFTATETVTVTWPTVAPAITTGVVDQDAR